jgi:glycerol kinase
MQFQADMLGVPVVVPSITETTVLGAAYLAGIAVGIWTQEDVRSMWTEGARYDPNMTSDERERLLADWQPAVQRSQRWVLDS